MIDKLTVADYYESGRCFCCLQDVMVRWKNLYVTGSEGLNICMPCETKVLDFIRKLSNSAAIKKVEDYKKIKQANWNSTQHSIK